MGRRSWTTERLGRRLQRIGACRRGNVAVAFALTMPVLIGAAGAGVETTYWYVRSQQLQAAADAAAYAAAIERRKGSADSVVESVADATVQQNGVDLTGNAGVDVGIPDDSQTVQVTVHTEEERFFTALFDDGRVDIRASATASYNSAANACVLALSPTASKAALFSGSSKLNLNGCSVMANSIANDAVTVQGSAQLSADCVISGGGANTTSNLTMTECPAVITQAPPAADPLKDLPVPTATGPCRNDNGATLQPGNYCHGLTLKGNVELKPGVYIISGGDLQANAQSIVTGAGVTIYVTGSGRVSLNGNATVQLSAPTSGVYAGILMFGDRANSSSSHNKFNGTAQSQLTGTLYFPSQGVDYLGNFSGKNGCSQIIGATVEWTGNSDMSVDCSTYGMKTIPVLNLVKLTA